ncbi:MAG: hypothetical protein N2746_11250 [Deltaproteobacteria bacterium]|nr:hypothetical protein [Deltaproteobacteria bacterium]
MRRERLIIYILLLLLFSYCKCGSERSNSEGKKEADKRSLDIKMFDRNKEVQKMVFETRFSDVARRFGDVIFEQKYTLEISSEKQKLELSNTDLLEHAKNGDYHIKVENSAGKMLEAYYIDGKLYVSMDGKRFFLHADDLVEARARKESVYAQANSFLKTYSDFIKFVYDGDEERDGVRFLRFKTELSSENSKKEVGRTFNLEEISGHVLIDNRSGGIVGVDLRGKIKYQKDAKIAISKFFIKSSIKKSQKPLTFRIPELGAEPQKLRIEKDLLQRLEKMEEKIETEKEEDSEISE